MRGCTGFERSGWLLVANGQAKDSLQNHVLHTTMNSVCTGLMLSLCEILVPSFLL